MPELPAPGQWPCQFEPHESPPERLVAALYRLTRDFIAPGDLEQVLLDVGDHAHDTVEYTNPHLHALAIAHAGYLTGARPSPAPRDPTMGGV